MVRTWAPQGQTPIHRHRQGRRDKISVISGISLSPRRRRLGLYYLLFFDNIGQEEVCRFLRELLRHLRGPLIVLLDNSSTHAGNPPPPNSFTGNPRLRIEYFPSYAPELNPDEGVWSLAKQRTRQRLSPRRGSVDAKSFYRFRQQVRRSPKRLRGCILESELPSFFVLSYCIIYAEINKCPLSAAPS